MMREVAYEPENKMKNKKRGKEVLENPMLFVLVCEKK